MHGTRLHRASWASPGLRACSSEPTVAVCRAKTRIRALGRSEIWLCVPAAAGNWLMSASGGRSARSTSLPCQRRLSAVVPTPWGACRGRQTRRDPTAGVKLTGGGHIMRSPCHSRCCARLRGAAGIHIHGTATIACSLHPRRCDWIQRVAYLPGGDLPRPYSAPKQKMRWVIRSGLRPWRALSRTCYSEVSSLQ